MVLRILTSSLKVLAFHIRVEVNVNVNYFQFIVWYAMTSGRLRLVDATQRQWR